MQALRDPFARLIGFFALATVLLELALLTQLRMAEGQPFFAGFWGLSGYFTIWSNLLVAYHFLTAKRSDGTHAAFTLTQIIIVALIYNFMLRGLRNLEGWFLLADNSLHVVVPALVFTYWCLFASKESLGFLDPLKWLWFVALYGGTAFARGAFSGKYAYPFIDVEKLGLFQVTLNSIGVGVAFYIVGASLVVGARAAKALKRKTHIRSDVGS